jgi:hypothetical protein
MTTLLGEQPCAVEACRLAKRWTAAQMLSFHMPDEAVELMVAWTFSGCVLWSLCCVLQRGLARIETEPSI